MLSPGLVPRVGWLAADLFLDSVERSDPVEDVGGERGRFGLMDIEDFTPKVRPAGALSDLAGGIERIIAGIGVRLEEAGKARQPVLRVRARTMGREPIPGERRRSPTVHQQQRLNPP